MLLALPLVISTAQAQQLTMSYPYPELDRAQLQKIKVGQTTESDIKRLLGDPDTLGDPLRAKKSRASDGSLVYSYTFKKTLRISPSESMVGLEKVEIIIDPSGKVARVVGGSQGHQEQSNLAKPKAKSEKEASNYQLLMASLRGDDATLSRLLANGADIETKGTNGETPLFLAVFKGHLSTVRLLLEKGADVNTKNNRGVPALCMAAFKGHKDIVSLLLAKGAPVNSTDYNGRTPLMVANKKGFKEVAQILKQAGGR
jgi:hypothetical protein